MVAEAVQGKTKINVVCSDGAAFLKKCEKNFVKFHIFHRSDPNGSMLFCCGCCGGCCGGNGNNLLLLLLLLLYKFTGEVWIGCMIPEEACIFEGKTVSKDISKTGKYTKLIVMDKRTNTVFLF